MIWATGAVNRIQSIRSRPIVAHAIRAVLWWRMQSFPGTTSLEFWRGHFRNEPGVYVKSMHKADCLFNTMWLVNDVNFYPILTSATDKSSTARGRVVSTSHMKLWKFEPNRDVPTSLLQVPQDRSKSVTYLKFIVALIMMIRSNHNFAHVVINDLSRYSQKFGTVCQLFVSWKQLPL